MTDQQDNRALHYLEQHYLDVIDFYKHSHCDQDYTPVCVVENRHHELNALTFSIDKSSQSKDIDVVITEYQQRIAQMKKDSEILSAMLIYHVDSRGKSSKASRRIEEADSFLITLYLNQSYYLLLPYQDNESEIVYNEIEIVEF